MLTIDISVGGCGADGFSETTSTAAGRRRFADSAGRDLARNAVPRRTLTPA